MAIESMILALVILGVIGFLLFRAMPPGAQKFVKATGKVLFILSVIALFLGTFALIGGVALICGTLFLLGTAFRYIGEKGSKALFPFLALFWEAGWKSIDKLRTTHTK